MQKVSRVTCSSVNHRSAAPRLTNVCGNSSHQTYKFRHLFGHFVPAQVYSFAVARQNPFKAVAAQEFHRLYLLRPGIPADITGSGEPAAIATPPDVITCEKELVPVEQGAMSARM